MNRLDRVVSSSLAVDSGIVDIRETLLCNTLSFNFLQNIQFEFLFSKTVSSLVLYLKTHNF